MESFEFGKVAKQCSSRIDLDFLKPVLQYCSPSS